MQSYITLTKCLKRTWYTYLNAILPTGVVFYGPENGQKLMMKLITSTERFTHLFLLKICVRLRSSGVRLSATWIRCTRCVLLRQTPPLSLNGLRGRAGAAGWCGAQRKISWARENDKIHRRRGSSLSPKEECRVRYRRRRHGKPVVKRVARHGGVGRSELIRPARRAHALAREQ